MDAKTLFSNPTKANFYKYLACGGDIHVKNINGDTLLYVAIEYKLTDIARLLIDKGVDINVKNKNGDTPLHRAIEYRLTDIVRLLIDHHADIDGKNNYGNTPLHYAIRLDIVDIARVLIENGADIHAKSKYGDTPLSLAKTEEMRNLFKTAPVKDAVAVSTETAVSKTDDSVEERIKAAYVSGFNAGFELGKSN